MQFLAFWGGFSGCFGRLEIRDFDKKKRGQDKKYVVYADPKPSLHIFLTRRQKKGPVV